VGTDSARCNRVSCIPASTGIKTVFNSKKRLRVEASFFLGYYGFSGQPGALFSTLRGDVEVAELFLLLP
jgi:hypothetical protein